MAHPITHDETSLPAPPGSLWCSDCRAPLRSYYYALDTRPVCPKCRMPYAAKISRGTGSKALVRALLFGGGAAALSALVLGGVILTVGVFRIVLSVGVGIAVGRAVRAATAGYLATRYQLIAAVFTYFAIGIGNLAPVFKALSAIEEPPHAVQADTTTDILGQPITPPGVKPRSSTDYANDPWDDLDSVINATNAARNVPVEPPEELTAQEIAGASTGKAIGILALLLLTLPLLSGLAYGIHGAALTVLGVGYGVYKAWAITGDATAESLTGPHKVGSGPISHTI